MRRFAQGRLLTGAVVATTAVLIAFTVLQYRSSREVTEATGVRLADTLQMSLVNWHVDFERLLTSLTGALDVQIRRDAEPDAVRTALDAWRADARYPQLVDGVLFHEGAHGGRPATTLRLDAPRDTATGVPPSVALDEDHAPTGWVFEPDAPALVRRLPDGPAPRWLVVRLNRATLANEILPDLTLRYFSGTDGLDYDVALFAAGAQALHASNPDFGRAPAADADGVLNVFGRRSSPRSGGPYEVFHLVPQKSAVPSVAVTWFALPPGFPDARDWRLVVRHRRGGALGAFLANAQRRDLLTTLGAIGLLVTSITLLVVASHRAQRLAQLQMNFVTAVSHELRTPLTVIGSAADNIARGVVRDPGNVAEYGRVIGQQSRQLGSLVERILLFASRTVGSPRPSLQPLSVEHAVLTTLSTVEGLTSGTGFTVERHIEPELPPVLGDATALAQCVENLLTNAVKYSGTARWIRVSATAVVRDDGHREVQLSIADKGIGIPAGELDRVFEPFYRSPAAIAAQIHGTGLGLALARNMAEMMGGRITVVSQPGAGSTFTLHLPAAPVPAAA